MTSTEGSHLRLSRAMKFIVGYREKMEGIDLVFPMTLPTLNPNPPKNSSSTLKALASKIDKGSQKYRQILTKNIDFITTSRVESWRADATAALAPATGPVPAAPAAPADPGTGRTAPEETADALAGRRTGRGALGLMVEDSTRLSRLLFLPPTLLCREAGQHVV